MYDCEKIVTDTLLNNANPNSKSPFIEAAAQVMRKSKQKQWMGFLNQLFKGVAVLLNSAMRDAFREFPVIVLPVLVIVGANLILQLSEGACDEPEREGACDEPVSI
jgi:hypothetical protein